MKGVRNRPRCRFDARKCFANFGGNCGVLNGMPNGKKCPFYKTGKELESERKAVVDQLIKTGNSVLLKIYQAAYIE